MRRFAIASLFLIGLAEAAFAFLFALILYANEHALSVTLKIHESAPEARQKFQDFMATLNQACVWVFVFGLLTLGATITVVLAKSSDPQPDKSQGIAKYRQEFEQGSD